MPALRALKAAVRARRGPLRESDKSQDALTGLRRTVGFSLATDDPRLAYEDEAHFLFAHEDDPGFTYGFAVRKADGRIFEWKFTPPTAEPKEE